MVESLLFDGSALHVICQCKSVIEGHGQSFTQKSNKETHTKKNITKCG